MPLVVVIVAYPLWMKIRESFLFKRRAFLGGAIREEALTRRLLSALILSALLLAMATRLNASHWGVLMVDALVMTGLYRFFLRRLASQVKPGYSVLQSAGGRCLWPILDCWPLPSSYSISS